MSMPLRECSNCKKYIWMRSTKCDLCGTDLPPISIRSHETILQTDKKPFSSKNNIHNELSDSLKPNQENDNSKHSFYLKNIFPNLENKNSSMLSAIAVSLIAFILTFNIYKPKEQLFRPMPSDPVAVRGYTKSNGEIVSSYHRKLPGQRGVSTPEQEVWFYQMKEDIKEYKSKRNDALIWSSILSLFCFYVLYNLVSRK